MTEATLPLKSDQPSLTTELVNAIENSDKDVFSSIFQNLNAVESAHLLETIPDAMRPRLWKYIPETLHGDVLVNLKKVARVSLADSLDSDKVINAVSGLQSSDLAKVIDTLPGGITEAIRESLDYQGIQDLDAALAFPENSAGRLLELKIIAIRSDVTLETVLRYLRGRASIPSHTTSLMVVDRNNVFQGELSLSALLTENTSSTVEALMNREALSVTPEMSKTDLAIFFEEHDLVSVPVVDSERRLLGRITVDSMVNLIHKTADQQIYGAVGLDEGEDLFAPIIPSAKRRLFWLGLNLCTAFLAAWVIALFQGVLDKVVALAVLMPIVASMGGIAGGQTLTLIIRGLSTGTISSANARWLAHKEIAISIISGFTWAIVVGIVSYLWFADARISAILGVAMIINLLAAAISGYGIPLIMKKVNIDPALAGGVVLTTATDVIGFVTFLGLATIFLV